MINIFESLQKVDYLMNTIKVEITPSKKYAPFFLFMQSKIKLFVHFYKKVTSDHKKHNEKGMKAPF